MYCFCVYLLILLTMTSIVFTQRIDTTLGEVEGFRKVVLGQNLDIFLGIPFAKPPVENLRFKHPEPVDPWRPEVKVTRTMKPSCPQLAFRPIGQPLRVTPDLYSEDCLYLNIWAPSNIPAGTKLATMVWVHGGGFLEGSISLPLYNGQYIAANNNVVLVSINYRVGALGFLYLGPETFPGNQGMMDQVLGLKWVYENIESFGGDKNKITIFGESAGAASVGHHLLSPLSRDYFTRAILQSGSPNAYWTSKTPDASRSLTQRFADVANCSAESDSSVFNCVHLLTSDQILEIQTNINDLVVNITFDPVIDGTFLTDDPSTLIRKGQVKKTDILIGVTKDEGTLFLAESLPDIFPPTNTIVINRTQFLTSVDLFARLQGDTKLLPAAIISQYASSKNQIAAESYVDIADDIWGDRLFKCPIVEFANEMSRSSKVYVFSHEDVVSSIPLPTWMGVPHSYGLEFVFGHPLSDELLATQSETDLSQTVMTYWTNFAKTGDPNQPIKQSLDWLQYDVTDMKYLVLGEGDKLTVQEGFRKQQCLFWNEIVPSILDKSKQPPTNPGSKASGHYWIILLMIAATF